MSGPVFATKWDFLFAWVLIGVDRSTGVWSGTQSAQGADMVCVWSSDQAATEALHVESWELKQITVRQLLGMLPPGVGVVVDPEHSTGITASPAYVANLKQYLEPFPVGSTLQLGTWDGLQATTRSALADAVSAIAEVSELYGFSYVVDDSPLLGCLAYVAPAGSDADAVAGALERVLEGDGDPAGHGVSTVNIVGMGGVPDEVRSVLGDDHLVHRRRRRGLWRR